MNTREELWQRFDLLLEQERLEEAGEVLSQIEPLSAEEWHARLDSFPEVDERPSPEALRRVAKHSVRIAPEGARRVG